MRIIKPPLDKKKLSALNAGEEVLLSGVIYTSRDQAHKRLAEAIKNRRKLPFDLKGKIIYYCGPTKAPRGKVVGSCGPTTASRMDRFTPVLLRKGLLAAIGKGRRSAEVARAIKKHKAVYFLTYAGCGALLAKCVKNARQLAYGDLGPEAIWEFKVKDFPLIVGIDSKGRSIYG